MTELYLAHHGVKGQKWGIRRYQDSNGNLTSAGKKKYFKDNQGNIRKIKRKNLKDFDYKKDEGYKKASRSERYRLSRQYNKDEILLGETAAKKLYLTDVRGSSHKVAVGKEFVKQLAGGIVVADLLSGGHLTSKAVSSGFKGGKFVAGSIKKTAAGMAAKKAARDAMPKLAAKKMFKVAKNVYAYR